MAKTQQRRKKNEGSIVKRKDGSWCGMATLGYADNGKRQRKYVYGKTREEVEKRLKDITSKLNLTSIKKEAFTHSFCDLMKEWLMVFKKTEVTSRTFENDIRNYKLHIYPYLRKMNIADVDVVVIKKLMNSFDSNEVRRKVKYLLNQFFDYAVEEKFVEYNPVKTIKTKVNKKEDISQKKSTYKAIRPEYRQMFLELISEDEFLNALCLVGYYSGLRIGEMLALRWKDVNLMHNTISVEYAISYDVEFDENGNVLNRTTIVTDPKTGQSKAMIPMPDSLSKVLRQWRAIQRGKEKDLKVKLTGTDNYIFCKDDGNVRTYSGTHSIFYRFLKKHNLLGKGFKFHALRHTYATILKNNKVDLYGIKSLLRHSKVSTTEKYLSDENDEALRMQVDVDNAFDVNAYNSVQPNMNIVIKKKEKDFEM